MTVSIDEAERRLTAALTAKSDAVIDSDPAAELDLAATVVHLPPPGEQRHRRGRLGIALAAAVAAAVALVVGWTVTSHGGSKRSEQPAGVPWSQVGPDWALLVTGPHSAGSPDVARNLVLKSPTGVVYPIADVGGDLTIDQGSWNHRTGLAMAFSTNRAVVIDLHTRQQRTIALTGLTGVIAAGNDFVIDQANRLSRVDANGHVVGHFDEPINQVYGLSPDGTQVVAGAKTGVMLFDVKTGKTVRRWPSLPKTTQCLPTEWVAGSPVIQGWCFGPQSVEQGADFSLRTGTTTPSTRPGGWGTVRLGSGTLAFRDPTNPLNDAVLTGLFKTELARVEPSGQLTPLTRPTLLSSSTWRVLQATTGGLLVENDDRASGDLVLWDPLTGKLIIYFSSPDGSTTMYGIDIWP